MSLGRTVSFWLAFSALFLTATAQAQNNAPPRQRSPLDATSWGVVYDVPATKHVKVRNGANDPGIFSGLGQIKYGQRQYEQAIPLLTRAIEAGMRNSFLYGQLASAQLHTGRNEEAIKTYEKAFAAGIPPGANTRGVAYFNLACGYTKLGQKEKALEALTNAVNEGFTNRSAYETDDDLAPLRAEPRFQELLARLPKS